MWKPTATAPNISGLPGAAESNWREVEPATIGTLLLATEADGFATFETSRRRGPQCRDASAMPDNLVVAIASADAVVLGVLSSEVHVIRALAAGGRHGVGSDPRENPSRCTNWR